MGSIYGTFMHTNHTLRRFRGRLAQLLGMNALILATLAALPVLLSVDLYTGQWLASIHVQPKLHEYCGSHVCALDPALVSTSYALQGVYSLAWSLLGGIAIMRSNNLGSTKTKTKAIGAVLICAVLFVFRDATGIDGSGFFKNYVHIHYVYLFEPTSMHIFVTSIVIASCWIERNYEAIGAARKHEARGV